MTTLVIERSSLPEPIYSYIKSELVNVSKENSGVVLSSAEAKVYDIEKIAKITQKWHKMFGDGRISTDDFIRQKSMV
jgi:hypothetical protein